MNAARKLVREVIKELDTPKQDSAFIALCEAFPLEPITNEKRYALALKILENAIDFSTSEETRAHVGTLSKYIFTLGVLVEEYEKKRFPRKAVSGSEMLEFLMEQQGLTQAELSEELGGQSVVSAILSGKRKLNLKQIRALAKRFGVSPAVFLGEAADRRS